MPEIKETESTNDKIASRLNNQEEVFPNNLDTMSVGEVAEILTNIAETVTYKVSPGVTEVKMQVPKESPVLGNKTSIVASQIPQQIVPKAEPVTKPTRTRKATPAVGKVSAEDIVAKMKEQINCIQVIDSISNIQEMPDNLSKAARDILLECDKTITEIKAKYIQQIQSL